MKAGVARSLPSVTSRSHSLAACVRACNTHGLLRGPQPRGLFIRRARKEKREEKKEKTGLSRRRTNQPVLSQRRWPAREVVGGPGGVAVRLAHRLGGHRPRRDLAREKERDPSVEVTSVSSARAAPHGEKRERSQAERASHARRTPQYSEFGFWGVLGRVETRSRIFGPTHGSNDRKCGP